MTTNAQAAICRGHDHPFTIEQVELADLDHDLARFGSRIGQCLERERGV